MIFLFKSDPNYSFYVWRGDELSIQDKGIFCLWGVCVNTPIKLSNFLCFNMKMLLVKNLTFPLIAELHLHGIYQNFLSTESLCGPCRSRKYIKKSWVDSWNSKASGSIIGISFSVRFLDYLFFVMVIHVNTYTWK